MTECRHTEMARLGGTTVMTVTTPSTCGFCERDLLWRIAEAARDALGDYKCAVETLLDAEGHNEETAESVELLAALTQALHDLAALPGVRFEVKG